MNLSRKKLIVMIARNYTFMSVRSDRFAYPETLAHARYKFAFLKAFSHFRTLAPSQPGLLTSINFFKFIIIDAVGLTREVRGTTTVIVQYIK